MLQKIFKLLRKVLWESTRYSAVIINFQSDSALVDKDTWEWHLDITHVPGDRGAWDRFVPQMWWFELCPFFFAFYGYFPRDSLQWVFLVVRERSKSLVIADFRRVGRLKCLIMLDEGCCLGLERSFRHWWHFLKDITMRVECPRPFNFLRKRFVLHHRVGPFSFSRCKLLRSIELVFHVWNHSTKMDIPADCSALHRHSLHVWRCDDHLFLLIPKALLDVIPVLHVLVCSLDRDSESTLGPERLFITVFYLNVSILSPGDF